MLRYLLFSGYHYYPSGGWRDFLGDFATIEEAKERTDKENDDWFQIIDSITKQEVDVK